MPFRLWPMQLDQEQRRKQDDARWVLRLKMRQGGSSAYELGRMVFHVGTTPDSHGLIMGHEKDLPTEFIERIGYMFQLTPEWAKPNMKIGKAEIIFPDVRSTIRVGTVRTMSKDGVGVKLGRTCRYLYGTEVANPAWTDNIIKVLLQVVSPETGQVAFESTADGARGWFYETYNRSKAGHTAFKSYFYQWWWHLEYARRVPVGFVPTTEERKLAALNDLTMEQLAWRRHKIDDELQGDYDRFREQYPESDVDCFLLSGSQFFDQRGLRFQLETPGCVPGIESVRGRIRECQTLPVA